MNDQPKYQIHGYSARAVADCDGDVQWITGYDAESEADTLKDAKQRAKYMLSEDYRRSGEMSECLAYVRVMHGADECVWDAFRKGFSFTPVPVAE